MSFVEEFSSVHFLQLGEKVETQSAAQVERVLAKVRHAHGDVLSFADLLALLSPAAAPYLAQMAEISRVRTQRRFGKTIQLYIPMYLTNACTNICTYCGFSMNNKIPRVVLSDAQILKEVAVVKELGFDHLLFVTGESTREAGIEYLENAVRLLRPHFSNLAMEVQPLEEQEYARLVAQGLHTVLVYQETYHRERYRVHHPKGKKSNFEYRLDTPDRLGRAGIRKIGLGVLLGLEPWRADAASLGLHLAYLRKRYWRTKFSLSFPRIRPAEGVGEPGVHVSERELLQLILAFRLFDENVELSLSTRERAPFRDMAVGLGITSMSAGSKTDPGGYATELEALEQFATDDTRTPSEVAAMIRSRGYEPVWKDWESVYSDVVAV